MRWQSILRFSQPTNFPACDDCVAYKDAFEDATDTRSCCLHLCVILAVGD